MLWLTEALPDGFGNIDGSPDETNPAEGLKRPRRKVESPADRLLERDDLELLLKNDRSIETVASSVLTADDASDGPKLDVTM